MPLFESINCRCVDGTLVVSPLTTEWTDCVSVAGLDTTTLLNGAASTEIAENLMFEAYQLIDEIPEVGDMHPVYPNTCCSSVNIRPLPGRTVGDSPDGIQAMVQWLKARTDSEGNYIKAVSVSQYQTQEIRNFDYNGDRSRVFYNLPNPDPRFPPYRIADIRVPRTMHSIVVSQFEDVSGKPIGQFANFRTDIDVVRLPIYNVEEFLGFPANTLLYLGNQLHHTGLPIARRDYAFMTNDRGWNKFIAVYTQQNGYVPKDLDELPAEAIDPSVDAEDVPVSNGIGVFNMLEFGDFSELLPHIYNAPL